MRLCLLRRQSERRSAAFRPHWSVAIAFSFNLRFRIVLTTNYQQTRYSLAYKISPILRVSLSLKQRTVPAHVIVQRLTNSFPANRLSRAVTNLGRIIKTQYILRYLTDRDLRRTVQLQLNKGEYRHKLPRRIFFANQGEFTTGDYEEIMNKASCLSLVSNAILYWNTLKITDIVEQLRVQGEEVAPETLAHISLLPFKDVAPNGTYFIEERGAGMILTCVR